MKDRHAARLLVVDERERVLLFRYEDDTIHTPGAPREPIFWATPGGGLEPGEDHEAAARRELAEETGLLDVPLGPWVWSRSCQVRWKDEDVRLVERYYLCRVGRPDVSLARLTPEEREVYRDHRWWAVADLATTEDVVFPRELAHHLPPLLTGRLPSTPIDVR